MLEKLLQAIREEGIRMLEAKDICAEEKGGPENIVTNYDKMVQENLERKFRELLPGVGFLGEEDLKANSDRSDGLFFIIDPIDGTMNFSRSYQRSCISVALAQEDRVVFGAVYDPYQDEMFWAERGKGAWLNGKTIHVSGRGLHSGLVMFGTSPYHRDLTDLTFTIARKLYDRSLDLRRSGSAAIDLCALAAGRIEVFFEVTLCPWDYAAASLILQEAGGVIGRMEGGEVALTESSSVLAASRAAWEEAACVVKECLA